MKPLEPFDYRDIEVKRLKQAINYDQKAYREDWETALACAHIMGFEPGHEHLEVILEACMDRVNAYQQVTGEMPWE